MGKVHAVGVVYYFSKVRLRLILNFRSSFVGNLMVTYEIEVFTFHYIGKYL